MNKAREWPEGMEPPYKSRSVTLIGKQGQDLVFAVNVNEKRTLLTNTKGQLWATWMGQWSAHLFKVNRKDITKELSP